MCMMKKFIIIGTILFLTSGCDNNLKCLKKAEYDGVDFNIKVEGQFKGGSLKSLEVNNEANLKGNYANYKEVFERTVNDYLDKFKGKNVKTTVDENDLNFKVVVSKFDKKISYSALKQSLMDDGYKCD